MFPQIFGKYVLEREIAAGGMARVYLATLRGAVGFEKRLVVKQIRTELASDDAFVSRFVEEAKTAVELSHPNIVPVYELGVEQGVYYIAMELCEGLTLSEILAETGPLGPTEGAYVGAEICRALDYAHRRASIVHRDVTPRNVLIDDEGEVRLIDFGIAAPVTRSDTGRSEVFGSPGHMPPEQLHGADLTPATDVFAVGVLLIEAWTGYPPFRRATAQESERALFSAPPPIDRQEPRLAPLAQLIARSVALEVRERPNGAEQLARPLREFLKAEDSGDIARSLGARVRRARRRSRSSSPWLIGESGQNEAMRTRPFHSDPASGADVTLATGSPVTRTFAAREDIDVWTRKLSSAPAPLLQTPAATPQSMRVAEERAAAAQRDEDDASREPPPISSPRDSNQRRSTAGIVAAILSSFAFVALAFVLGSHREPPRAAEQSRLPAQEPRPIAPSNVALVQPGPNSDSMPLKAARASAVAGKIPKPSGTPRSSNPSQSAPAPAQSGLLRITADPPASVEVSGAGFHDARQTPVLGLKVPAGKYQIVFRNDTIGTPLSAEVMVVAGASRSVHADFRQAEPTVNVH